MAMPDNTVGDEEKKTLEMDARDDNDEGSEADAPDEPPMHPVPALQAPFEESIIESIENSAPVRPAEADAERRRQTLLDSQNYDDSWKTRWGLQPSAVYHPMLKLMAQIVFGMHLLQQQQAKSDEEVVRILQSHVNEIDTFLQQTAEDFDLAIRDIEDRIRFLKLPMEHLEVFEVMLEDRKFRTQLLEGNGKIQSIMDRTTQAMNGTLLDIHKALEATKELGRYLDSVDAQWPRHKPRIEEVYDTMRGNEQGWKRYLKDLQSTGNTLGSRMVQLASQMKEMSKLAAAASRRSKKGGNNAGAKSAPSSPGLRSKFFQDTAPPVPTDSRMTSPILNKPLPQDPVSKFADPPKHIPKLDLASIQGEPERSSQMPLSPTSSSSRSAKDSLGALSRPKTAESKKYQAREARSADSRGELSDLIDFFKRSKQPSPLRSNPPDALSVKSSSGSSSTTDKNFIRPYSRGVGGGNPMSRHNYAPSSTSSGSMPRSLSQPILETSLRQDPANLFKPSMEGKNTGGSVLSAIPEQQRQYQNIPSNGFTRRLSKRMKHIPASLPLSPTGTTAAAGNLQSPLKPPAPFSDTSSVTSASSWTANSTTKSLPLDQSKPSVAAEMRRPKVSPGAFTGGTPHASIPIPAIPSSPARSTGDANGLKSAAAPSSGYRRGSATAGSLAETTASRRYMSLKKILRKREDDSPRVAV